MSLHKVYGSSSGSPIIYGVSHQGSPMWYQVQGHKLYVVSRRGHQLYGGTVVVTTNNPTVPTYIHTYINAN